MLLFYYRFAKIINAIINLKQEVGNHGNTSLISGLPIRNNIINYLKV